jgi:hypothetical protein
VTDQEMRNALLSALGERVADFQSEALFNRRCAVLVPASDPGRIHEYQRIASVCDRRSAHYQQAIDLLTAAPMPERSET